MRLPLTDAEDVRSIDRGQLEKMVDYFIEHGFTYFDTAYMYHEYTSEEALRTALVEPTLAIPSQWLQSCRSCCLRMRAIRSASSKNS